MDWGTLAAVVVGGALTITSNVWFEARRWRREDDVRWKAEQKDAYASYLSATWSHFSSMRRAVAWGRRPGHAGEELLAAVVAAQNSVEQALGLLYLFAPDDTLAAAEDLMIFYTGAVGEAERWIRTDSATADWSGYDTDEARLRVELMRLMKRDLGIADRTPRVPMMERLR